MPNTSIEKKILKQAIMGMFIAVAGVLVNLYFPIRGPFGADFIIGSAFAYFYLQFDRKGWGAYIVAAVITSSTWILWGHPYAAMIMIAEFVFVARLLPRLNQLASVTLFWLAIGPLAMALFYGQLLHFPADMWFIVYIKQAMNGLLCVSVGTFLGTFVRLTFNDRHYLRPLSVIGFATTGILPFVLIPTLLLTFEKSRQESEIRLDLHAVAWTQFVHSIGEEVAPSGRTLSEPMMGRALQSIKEGQAAFADFAPMRIEAINSNGEVTSVCYPVCPRLRGVNETGGTVIDLPGVPDTMLFLPQRDSRIQRWRDGSLTSVLPAEAGRLQIRASTSLVAMVDRSFMELRQDFFVLIAAVMLILAVGGIMYNRILTPFTRMRATLDSWQGHEFTVPELPPQKFVEIERFRLLIEQVSKTLTRERDRSRELQMQLNAIGVQSPMIFAAWLLQRRYAKPRLHYISAQPEARLMIGADLFAEPHTAISRLHPEDRPALRALLSQLAEEGHAGGELRVMGLAGEWRWILLRLSSRRAVNGMDEVIGVFTDITELNSMREMLGQNNGIRMIGKMVAGLAHELNQPLNVISMAADNLLHFVTTHSEALGAQERYLKEKSEKILHQVRRAGTLLATVESVANQDAGINGSHDLGEMLRSSCDAVERFAESCEVELVREMPDAVMMIHGSKQALTESFSAVLRNAIEAVHGRPAYTEEGFVKVHVSYFAKLSRVKIEFIDNGPGIDPEIMPYLFSPFMSIKATAHGAGLSLARLFSLVQACGGEVYARNQKVGATITIYLPLA